MIAGYQLAQGGKVDTELSDDEVDDLWEFVRE